MMFAALLRGVNVGGKNVVKMSDLKASFESLGFSDVATMIQSGNVIFSSKEENIGQLTKNIENTLSKRLGCPASVVVVSREQLRAVVNKAPPGFGKEAGQYRYGVIFLKEPLSAAEAMKNVKIKEGVDEVFAGPNVVYFMRIISRASQSRLSRLTALPIYKSMTLRNWNTVTNLLALVNRNP